MRGPYTETQRIEAALRFRHNNLIRLSLRLIAIIDSQNKYFSIEDRQLIDDVFTYGRLQEVSRRTGVPEETVSYRYNRILEKMEEITAVAELNSELLNRVAEQEKTIKELSLRLDKTQKERDELKEELKRMKKEMPSPNIGNIDDFLDLKLEEVIPEKKALRKYKMLNIEKVRDVVKLSKQEYHVHFGNTRYGMALEYRLKMMGLHIGMDLDGPDEPEISQPQQEETENYKALYEKAMDEIDQKNNKINELQEALSKKPARLTRSEREQKLKNRIDSLENLFIRYKNEGLSALEDFKPLTK